MAVRVAAADCALSGAAARSASAAFGNQKCVRMVESGDPTILRRQRVAGKAAVPLHLVLLAHDWSRARRI